MGMASSGDEGSTRGGSSSSSSSGASEGSGGPEDSSSSEEGSDKEGGGTATATGGAQGVREGEGGGRGGVGQGRIRRAVWADPADAALSVSLASSARTRKLRNSHKQDKVSGLAYEAALRKQHAALHTRTAWAQVKPRSSLAGRQAGLGGDPAGEEEEEEEDRGVAGLLTSAHSLLDRGPGRLPPGLLETSRVKDANQGEPCQGVVRSVSFHPAAAGLMLTASLDRKLRLFQVDGVRNSAVQTVFLADCPIQQASWAAGGAQVVMAGRRPHFYCYDLGGGRVERVLGPAGCPGLKSLERFAASPAASGSGGGGGSESLLAFMGDQGYLPLMSLSSRQWVANLKMSGSARCAAFVPGTHELMSLGSDGVVHSWDLRTRRCLWQLRDTANVAPSALAVSRDGRYWATGSGSGVVNVYNVNSGQLVADATAAKLAASLSLPESLAVDRDEEDEADDEQGGALAAGGALLQSQSAARPRPTVLGGGIVQVPPQREVLNLTTTVDSLTFSPDGQVMAMASRMKRDAMRLVHLPSATVFSNWPTSRSPLHYVHSVAFSPNGGFLAVGNARGKVLLYRLHHYTHI
ncbi:WD40-repeat-containing domain protein [Haematococcus lacustris]